MIVKLVIISSISTISFIHICNMNDINNNIVRIYHNGGAIMASAKMLLSYLEICANVCIFYLIIQSLRAFRRAET